MGARASIAKPTLDCLDLEASSTFWAWLLDVEVIHEHGSVRYLGSEPGGPVLCLQQVGEPRVGKNRMHLDLLTDELDELAAEVEARGGSRLSELRQIPTGRWYVMSDPEGN